MTARTPERTYDELLNTIRDSPHIVACYDDEEDGEAEDNGIEHEEVGKPSEDDKPVQVMNTIGNTVQHRM